MSRRTLIMALPGLHRVRRGAETAMESLATCLARTGDWDVTVFGAGDPVPDRPYRYERLTCPELDHYARRPSLPLLRTPAQHQEWTFARALRRAVRGRRWEASLACSWPWTHFALRGLADRHVFWTQNGDHMISARRAEYAAFACDGLLCTNPDYFARHRGRFRSVLLPNGVDPDRFSPGPGQRDALGLPRECRIALVVSALVKHKRVDRAVRTVAAVPGVHLVVAGEGPEATALDRLAAGLLPGRYTRMCVPRERMPGLYRSADLLLHPCDDEPSANAWSEALASGLPVVAADMPVTRWVLRDTGVLTDVHDDAALTRAVHLALSHAVTPAERHASARARLSWNAIAADVSEFLTSLLPSPASDEPRPVPGSPGAPATTGASEHRGLGVVVIGRNEGKRLVRCLASLPRGVSVVYVDSGSGDGSVEAARQAGADVVSLDPAVPFTAARARNVGAARLPRACHRVLFLDGDTELLAGFLPAALAALDAGHAVAAGRRRERHPDATVYNRLCDMEWNTPPGPATTVGGDALYDRAAFEAAGGFDASLIAGEEPELALRLRRGGHTLLRLPVDMTLHDAGMTRPSQWYRRHQRAGHAYAEGHHRHGGSPDRYRCREVRSIVAWTSLLPLTVGLSLLAPWALLLGLAYPVLALKAAAGQLRRGDPPRHSLLYGVSTALAKSPQLHGLLAFHLARLTGRRRRLIEYKSPSLRTHEVSQ